MQDARILDLTRALNDERAMRIDAERDAERMGEHLERAWETIAALEAELAAVRRLSSN